MHKPFKLALVVLLLLVIFSLLLWWLRPKPAQHNVYTVSPSMSEAQIQSIMNTADSAPGGVVNFTAGSYGKFTFILQAPCKNGVVYAGPPNSAGWVYGPDNKPMQPTAAPAILNADGALRGDSTIYVQGGNPTNTTEGSGCTFQDLQGYGENFILTGGTSYSNAPSYGILMQRLTVAGVENQGGVGGSAIFMHDTSYSAVRQSWFGPNCTKSLGTYSNDNCSGGLAVGQSDAHITIAANWFQTGMQAMSSGGDYNTGCLDCKYLNNVIGDFGRMGFEFTNGNSPGNVSGTQIKGNVFQHANHPWAYSFAVSMACCYTGPGPMGYSYQVEGNVFLADTPVLITGSGAHYGYCGELTGGSNSTFKNNLCQGYWPPSPGIAIGNLHVPFDATSNTAHGTLSPYPIGCEYGGVWPDRCLMSDGVTVIGPVTYQPVNVSANISQIVVPAPSIAPLGGTVAAAPLVTLTANGPNETLFYTLDGSPASTKSRVYTVPFTPPSIPATVRAIASWGTGAAQAISFTPPYGYAPSPGVTATYTGGPPTPTVVSITVAPATAAVVVGATQQYTALLHLSDNSTAGCAAPACTWGATSGATITAAGLATATAAGSSTIAATVGSVSGNAMLTVTAVPPPTCNQITLNGIVQCGTASITTTAPGKGH